MLQLVVDPTCRIIIIIIITTIIIIINSNCDEYKIMIIN